MTTGSQGDPTLPPQLLAALRSEIIQAQQITADFLKWKLLGAATVASLALGFGMPSSIRSADASLLICLIPFICSYVDLASLDLVIRVIVIARFLRLNGDQYETFVAGLRASPDDPFRFAPIAVHLSSAVMNGLIAGLGFFGAANGWTLFRANAYIATGMLGLIFTLLLWRTHKSKITSIVNYQPNEQGGADPVT